jgi:hypothetical protein
MQKKYKKTIRKAARATHNLFFHNYSDEAIANRKIYNCLVHRSIVDDLREKNPMRVYSKNY